MVIPALRSLRRAFVPLLRGVRAVFFSAIPSKAKTFFVLWYQT
jgi:hypothetical protein